MWYENSAWIVPPEHIGEEEEKKKNKSENETNKSETAAQITRWLQRVNQEKFKKWT